jgi:hypothetical protein
MKKASLFRATGGFEDQHQLNKEVTILPPNKNIGSRAVMEENGGIIRAMLYTHKGSYFMADIVFGPR